MMIEALEVEVKSKIGDYGFSGITTLKSDYYYNPLKKNQFGAELLAALNTKIEYPKEYLGGNRVESKIALTTIN